MYVGMATACNRLWINRVRLLNLLVVSWTGKMKCPYCRCIRGKDQYLQFISMCVLCVVFPFILDVRLVDAPAAITVLLFAMFTDLYVVLYRYNMYIHGRLLLSQQTGLNITCLRSILHSLFLIYGYM